MDIVLFVGPSISPQETAERFPTGKVLPPAGRGDLMEARQEGAKVLVLIDGVFGQTHAVAPSEIVAVIRSGAVVVGASSMGAVRGAECWPVGMVGIGQVFQGFRDGTLENDDEVAVVTDSDGQYRATTVPLVNVRAALGAIENSGHVDRTQRERLWREAKAIHFADRTWRMVFHKAAIELNAEIQQALQKAPDPKREDAIAAIDYVRQHAGELLARATAYAPTEDEPGPRYVGHDPLMGRSEGDLQRELLHWMVGSGRLQRYVWPLIVAEPETREISSDDPEERSGLLRERLALALRRLLSDEAAFAKRLWYELEFLEELPTEILHLEAAQVAARQAGPPSARAQLWAREAVATEQGYRSWSQLIPDVTEGALYGALPMVWIEKAVNLIAASRFSRL